MINKSDNHILNFTINGDTYNIKEIDFIGDESSTVGQTEYQERTIYLKKLDSNFMIKTLKHELMHVWLFEYGHNQAEDSQYSYDDVCEIAACSNDFVNKVVELYIRRKEEIIKNKEK